MLLAHLSDPHLGGFAAPGLRHLLNKRGIGYVNWRLNRSKSWDADRLQQVVAAIHSLRPDHIAVTGDLVNVGLPDEIERAARWLASLGDPSRVTAVPGNHDAYVETAVDLFKRDWAAFMRGDEIPAEVSFPFVRRLGDVAVMGLSTAVATPPFMATGQLGRQQADRAEAALAALGRAGLFRVVLIHHPPAVVPTSRPRRLIDGQRLDDLLARAGAELVLHGHNHRATVHMMTTPSGAIPIVGATSASGLYRHGRDGEAGFNLIRIERVASSFACRLTHYAWSGADIVVLAEHDLSRPPSPQPGTFTQA